MQHEDGGRSDPDDFPQQRLLHTLFGAEEEGIRGGGGKDDVFARSRSREYSAASQARAPLHNYPLDPNERIESGSVASATDGAKQKAEDARVNAPEAEESARFAQIRTHVLMTRVYLTGLRTFMFLRTSLWTWPLFSMVLNFALGSRLASIAAPRQDVDGYTAFFHGSASEASSIFRYVGGFVMSLTGVVFSLAIVAFQVAAVNYSPRVLHDLMRKSSTKAVLAVFLGTFTYSYGALLTVKDTDTSSFAPTFAVNFMLAHVLLVIMALVYYLDFVVRSLSVAKLLDDISRNTRDVVETLSVPVAFLPEEDAPDLDSEDADLCDIDCAVKVPTVPAKRAYSIFAKSSGYLVRMSIKSLALVAAAHNIVIRMRVHVGEFTTKNTNIAWVWRQGTSSSSSPPRTDSDINDRELESITDQLSMCLFLSVRRSIQDDISFGLKQLSDIALKALSPGVNDPSTAVETIDRLEELFAHMSMKQMTHTLVYRSQLRSQSVFQQTPKTTALQRGRGAAEDLLLAVPRSTFTDLLDLAVHPIRYYGKSDVTVSRRLLYMLGAVGGMVKPFGVLMQRRLSCIEGHIERIMGSAANTFRESSPEFAAILYAAQHAYFLIHGGKTDRVHSYGNSTSDEEGSEREDEAKNRARKMTKDSNGGEGDTKRDYGSKDCGLTDAAKNSARHEDGDEDDTRKPPIEREGDEISSTSPTEQNKRSAAAGRKADRGRQTRGSTRANTGPDAEEVRGRKDLADETSMTAVATISEEEAGDYSVEENAKPVRESVEGDGSSDEDAEADSLPDETSPQDEPVVFEDIAEQKKNMDETIQKEEDRARGNSSDPKPRDGPVNSSEAAEKSVASLAELRTEGRQERLKEAKTSLPAWKVCDDEDAPEKSFAGETSEEDDRAEKRENEDGEMVMTKERIMAPSKGEDGGEKK